MDGSASSFWYIFLDPFTVLPAGVVSMLHMKQIKNRNVHFNKILHVIYINDYLQVLHISPYFLARKEDGEEGGFLLVLCYNNTFVSTDSAMYQVIRICKQCICLLINLYLISNPFS